MSRNDRPIHDPNVIAAVHEVGGRWRAVVARREPARDGSDSSDEGPSGLRVIESENFPAESVARRLPEWLTRHQCGRVVGVLPATAAICRTSQLPNGPTERLIPALRLQAEGHLLGDVPAHRLAMAILPAGAGESTRTGMITAWPPSAPLSDSALALDRSLEVDHSWMPETAALAALVDRRRPTEPIVWCDRASGGVAIILTHPAGVLIRAVREENGTPEEWIGGVGRVVADSALSVGHSTEQVGSAVLAVQSVVGGAADGGVLALPAEIERALPGMVAGATTDRGWWQTYGIAVGALIGATGPLAALATLRREPAIETPSPISAVAERLSTPKMAAILAIVALALVVVWPVAAASLRLAILRAKVPELRAVQNDVDELERTLAMYRALGEQTFPMHKLLADVANSTPDGIEIETLTISRADGVSIRGQAARRDGRSAEDLVLLMSTRMNENRVFDQTSPSWDVANAMGIVNFRLNAKVPRPYLPVNYTEEWDFGALTLADRRYGKSGTEPASRAGVEQDRTPAESTGADGDVDATSTPIEVVSAETPGGVRRPSGGGRPSTRGPDESAVTGETGETDDPTASDDAQAHADDASGDGGGGASDIRRLGSRGTGEASGAATRGRRLGGSVEEVPTPLSREQIRSLSRAEAQSALAAVSRARMRSDLDEETSARLREEFDLLLQQTQRGG